MLLKCEIDKIANRMRNYFVILSNLILILKSFDKNFFKKTFEFICYINNLN